MGEEFRDYLALQTELFMILDKRSTAGAALTVDGAIASRETSENDPS